MINDWPITKKFVASFSLLVLASLISAAFVFAITGKVTKGIESNEQNITILNKLSAYEDSFLSSHATIMALINSGDIQHIKKYKESVKLIDESYQQLKKQQIEAGYKEQAEQLSKLEKLIKQWQETIVTKQLIYMQDPYTVDLARLLEASVENSTLWKMVSENLEDIKNHFKAAELATAANQQSQIILIKTAIATTNILSMGLAIGLAILLSRTVALPMRNLAIVTNQLKDKNWEVEINNATRKDEIGQMAQALEVFRNNGKKSDSLERQQTTTAQQKLQRAKEIQDSVSIFRSVCIELLNNLSNAAKDMGGTSSVLENVAGQSHDSTQNVSHSIRNTSLNVQNAASAVEEMSTSIKDISVQIQKVSYLTRETVTSSQDAVYKVNGLKASSDRINQVVELIDNIATQINLLALNATIESSRAGEAGKGFAVVAQEVKDLATQTAKATEEVQSVIANIRAEITEVVKTIGNISGSIGTVDASSAGVAAAVEQQSIAVREIATNISRVSDETGNIVQNIGSVEEKVRETKNVAIYINKLSNALEDCNKKLNFSIDKFIGEVTNNDTHAA